MMGEDSSLSIEDAIDYQIAIERKNDPRRELFKKSSILI